MEFDLVGPWTEVKLDILREYAPAYSKILRANGFYHAYIDAFAAGGAHVSRTTGEIVPGSPLIALSTDPPFDEYHFIDKDEVRVEQLRQFARGRTDVHVHFGDCNTILPRDVFPRIGYEDRKRALCLLDPFNIDLSWNMISTAGTTKAIEIFVNFMVMDMNMNVLLQNPSKAEAEQLARMERFWGDASWRDVIYELSPQIGLFGESEQIKKENANDKIAEAYRHRLIDVAGYAFATTPLRFVNRLGRTIYYLFFASPNPTGSKIVGEIFEKYRTKQGL